jgi:UDP-N-acetylmuramoylalanine--D-glutamate ligase
MTETDNDYSGKTVLVVGAARSGLASARFLVSRGAQVTLTDSQDTPELREGVAPLLQSARIELGGHNRDGFRHCDLVVVSPGVPLSLPEFEISRRAGIPVIAEVELAFRHLKGTILGITGSNGKTTTTALTAELLRAGGVRAFAAGNIGQALIGFADGSTSEDVYVTELSSFQLEGICTFRPKVAALLNLSPDHLDRYAGFEDYIRAKMRIFMNQQRSDFAVLNLDDPRTSVMAPEISARPLWFSRAREADAGAFVRTGSVVYRDAAGDRALFAIADVALKGQHNMENVLAACALALLGGADSGALRDAVRRFRGVEHRLEWVAEIDGVQYFNDSKATNVDATIKSLEAFPGGICLIAGGRDKGGDFGALRPLVSKRVKHVILIGEAAGKIREALAGTVEMSEAASLPEAVAACRRLARRGDVVLLAPACASFDMFQNYEQRGRVFKEAVRSIQAGA